MTNSIDERLNKLNKLNETKISRRMATKVKFKKEVRNRKPSEPNYLTSRQVQEARLKFGIQTGCMICGKKPSLKKAHAIDHCHVIGTIRGILCHNCNMGLGYFKEDVEILRSAIRYMVLNKFSADSLTDEEWERLTSIQNR